MNFEKITFVNGSSVIVNEPMPTEFDVNQLNSRLYTDTDNKNFHILKPGTVKSF